MSPLVSAVVPFYGVEEYIRPCLDSIRAQTLEDFEVILVDDGSPDRSAELAREVVALDDRFRIVTQQNQGLGPARNTGTAEATGRYLMFLDSDDLLAPRAFEQLATSLEQSGSDFAGGHVWRLGLARGLETSWAHREPFAERLQRTSIREVPLLMRDRMVWNKMWRRSFWDAGGYEFPAIRFEDFPVTLKAHLEARAVDTLPDPMYVWRERPSGDSISQQGKQLGNVRDRVTAALSVLGTVDDLGTPEVRELVHSHLVDVDVREVMGSLVIGLPEDQPAIEDLARRLADRIDPKLVGLASPDLQISYRALRDGDLDRVRAIARYRDGERSPEALRAMGKERRPLPVRAWDKGMRTVGRADVLPTRARQVHLEDVAVLPDAFHYRLSVRFRPQLGSVVRARAAIGPVRPKVVVSTLPTGIQLDVTVDTADLLRLGGAPAPLRVTLGVGPLQWEGGVRIAYDQLHGTRRAGYWMQAVSQRGELAFTRSRRTVVVDRVDLVEDRVRLHTDVAAGTLLVERSWPAAPLEVAIEDHVAHVDAAALVADDPADDPVSGQARRRVLLRRPVRPSGEQVADRVVLSGPGITTIQDGRRVRVGRDWNGAAVVSQEPRSEDEATEE